MEREMSFDADLLGTMIDCQFPIKTVAHLTGRHRNTVEAYRNGRMNIPVDFWRQLYEKTRDLRIPMLILGDVPCTVTVTEKVPDLLSDEVSLRAAIDSIGKFHALQKYLVEIIADGEINQSDREQVAQYNDHYTEFVRHNAAIHNAVNRAFTKSLAPKG